MDKYQVIYKRDDNINLVKMSFRNFMIYTENWIYNRDINEDRVNSIYEAIKNNTNIGWTLHAFENSNKTSIKILDGQHRGEAIRRYLRDYDTYMDCNKEITLWIYQIDNEENDEEKLIELFTKINTNIQVNEFELPSKRKIELIKLLKLNPIISKGIRLDPKSTIAHQPYIHIKEFKVLLDVILKDNYDMTNEEIINNIININNRIRYLTSDICKLFGKKQLNEKRLLIIDKCHNIDFYLNIKESIYNKEIWVKFIRNPEMIK
jgi:hypothetical protein